MKPVSFGYERPQTLKDAHSILQERNGESKILSGGQSLGPMLNLRLVQPKTLIDVSNLPDLVHAEDRSRSVIIGACVTHANIEDRLVPDPSQGMMPCLASGIAYRAVRNRGTIGGSLCHADPAADWISILTALDAKITISGHRGRRVVPISSFVKTVFDVDLATDELLESIEIPRLSDKARWGYYKFCRKTGEFAEAIGVVVIDPCSDICRFVIGATSGAPYIVPGADSFLTSTSEVRQSSIMNLLIEKEMSDLYERELHVVALERALQRANA